MYKGDQLLSCKYRLSPFTINSLYTTNVTTGAYPRILSEVKQGMLSIISSITQNPKSRDRFVDIQSPLAAASREGEVWKGKEEVWREKNKV